MSLHSEIVELESLGWDRSAIAQALGCSKEYVRAALARHRQPDYYNALNRDGKRRRYQENPKRERSRQRAWLAKNPGKAAEYKRNSRLRNSRLSEGI